MASGPWSKFQKCITLNTKRRLKPLKFIIGDKLYFSITFILLWG